jgi:hypothetical protein
LRGLAAYAGITGDPQVRAAVERAAEIFLKRHLFLRVSDGSVMNQEFLKLRYPAYHFYNILWALKIMGEAGYLHDPRCQPALDLLQSKQLGDGSFAAEGKYYYPAHKPAEITWHGSRVNWGQTGRGKSNEYITLEALAVLRTAGRLSLP